MYYVQIGTADRIKVFRRGTPRVGRRMVLGVLLPWDVQLSGVRNMSVLKVTIRIPELPAAQGAESTAGRADMHGITHVFVPNGPIRGRRGRSPHKNGDKS